MFNRSRFSTFGRRRDDTNDNEIGADHSSLGYKNGGTLTSNTGNKSKVSKKLTKSSNVTNNKKDATGHYVDKTLQGPSDLCNFDACVEASDALAASSSHGSNSNHSPSPRTDCSVMVSPDGVLLFLPRVNPNTNVDPIKKGRNVDASAGTERPKCDDEKLLLQTEMTSRDIINKMSASETSTKDFYPSEEYESAIIMGNDLTPGGDKAVNGFCAKGWNPDIASVAIRRSESTLRATSKFVEELILSHKSFSASESHACYQLKDLTISNMTKSSFDSSISDSDPYGYNGLMHHNEPIVGRNSCFGMAKKDNNNDSSSSNLEQCDRNIEFNPNGNISDGVQGKGWNHHHSSSSSLHSFPSNSSINDIEKSRAGPLLFPSSTLHSALVAMEQYHTMTAEADSHRWKKASMRTSVGGSGPEDGILPQIQLAAMKAEERAVKRERALLEAHIRAEEAEMVLASRKEEAKVCWDLVFKAEENIKKRMEEKTRERSRAREMRRRQEENERQASIVAGQLDSTVTQQEIWELVSQVSENMDGSFAPTGLPMPNADGPIDQSINKSISDEDMESYASATNVRSPTLERPPSPTDIRAEIEDEISFNSLRLAAVEADEDVQDAAGALLNVLSSLDTTRRSARIAAEACLLSTANAQANCLRSLVEIERASLEERMCHLETLERKVKEIDVRTDLNKFIEHEKKHLPHGSTRLGDDDDGGIASALAVLNCHSEGVGVGVGVAGTAEMSAFSGWNDDDDTSNIIDRDEIEDAVAVLFHKNPFLPVKKCGNNDLDDLDEEMAKKENIHLDESIEFLVKAVGEKSIRARGYRASTCYALNNQRGTQTQIDSEAQFNGLCSVLEALLTGCDRESADVANAKMCMILAQTFYFIRSEEAEVETNKSDREKRMYPKIRLVHHPIWSDEDFWVQALFQCVTDSLTNSGVMTNFEIPARGTVKGKAKTCKIKWHDLNSDERSEAASQVHAVIFAQLGALAHSMIEFGCSIDQACAFVRRLSIRHQLPLSQRSMLLDHLIERNSEIKGDQADNSNSRISSEAISTEIINKNEKCTQSKKCLQRDKEEESNDASKSEMNEGARDGNKIE